MNQPGEGYGVALMTVLIVVCICCVVGAFVQAAESAGVV